MKIKKIFNIYKKLYIIVLLHENKFIFTNFINIPIFSCVGNYIFIYFFNILITIFIGFLILGFYKNIFI